MYSTKGRQEENKHMDERTELKTAMGAFRRRTVMILMRAIGVFALGFLHRPQGTSHKSLDYLLRFCDAHGIKLVQ